MKERLISPPNYIETADPIIFLAGPIQGAADWQKEAVRVINSLDPKVCIANPRREYMPGDFIYEEQVKWERHYLNKSGLNGVILFWLAKEAEHLCERAYAQTTRVEFGQESFRHKEYGTKLVLGIEEGFSGAKYFRYVLKHDCPGVSLHSSLEETCKKAVRLLYS